MLTANYHTHTYRCGHAGDYPDEAYVQAAVQAGYKVLGMSDHTPWPFKRPRVGAIGNAHPTRGIITVHIAVFVPHRGRRCLGLVPIPILRPRV